MTIAEEQAIAAALHPLVDGGRLRTTAGAARTGRSPDPIGAFDGTVGGRPISIALEDETHRDHVLYLHLRVPIAAQPFGMRVGPDAPALGLAPTTTGDPTFDGAMGIYTTNAEVLRAMLDADTRANLLHMLDRRSFIECTADLFVYKVAIDDMTQLRPEQMHGLVSFAFALADRAVGAVQWEVRRIAQMGGPQAVAQWMAAQSAERGAAVERRQARARKILGLLVLFMLLLMVVMAAIVLSVVRFH